MWKTDKHTGRKRFYKGFLVLLLAHTLFNLSSAPKVLLKTGAVEKELEGKEKKINKKYAPFGLLKTQNPTINNLRCELDCLNYPLCRGWKKVVQKSYFISS